jgi:ribose/xylose/arabinose/galactoside ABC-type transport system permease subunit
VNTLHKGDDVMMMMIIIIIIIIIIIAVQHNFRFYRDVYSIAMPYTVTRRFGIYLCHHQVYLPESFTQGTIECRLYLNFIFK